MSWVEKVHCIPCQGTTNWEVRHGVWTCPRCGAHMTTKAIADMYAREKAGMHQNI